MKTHTQFQIHQLNAVRLNMKLIFSSVVNTYYITGNPDVTTSSSYAQPATNPSHQAKKKCINFIRSLTNGDRSLTINLGSNKLPSCHIQCIDSMSKDETRLCLKRRPYQWFSLYPASRGYFAMTPSLKIFRVTSLNFYLRLSLHMSLIIVHHWRSRQIYQFIGTHQLKLLLLRQIPTVSNWR